MPQDQTRPLRTWLAAGTALVLLVSLLVAGIQANIEGPVILFLLIFQIPLFVPTAIYYFGATGPRAAWVCGIILAGLTIPLALLVPILDEPPYFLVGTVLFLTLISSIVGAVISRSQRVR